MSSIIGKTITALFLLFMSYSVFACGNLNNVNDCDTPEDAFEAISQNNPHLLKSSKQQLAALFDYNSESIRTENFQIQNVNRNDFLYITFDMIADNPLYKDTQLLSRFNNPKMKVKVHYFKSISKEGPRPLIIGYPTVLQLDMAEPLFARFMAKKGISVMVPDVESIVDITVPLKEVDNLMRRTVIKGRMLIDLAETTFKEEINAEKIGAWGLSLGGVRAVNLMGVDSRVKAAAIVSSGGNNADIFTHSEQEYVRDYRNNKIETENEINDKNQYFSYIRKASNVESIYLAKNISPQNIFMIMAKNDALIPTRNQLELWNALGRPGPLDKNWKRGKHKSPIIQYLLVPWFKRRVLKFYTERLNGID